MTTMTTTETSNLAARITGRYTVTGGNAPADVAAEWIDAGFSADEALAWMDAGGFEARRCGELAGLGVTPEQAGGRDPRSGETLAYAVSNGDMSAAKAAKLVAE